MKNSLLKIIAVICIVMCFTGAVSGIGEPVTDNETTTQTEETTQTAEETTQKTEEPTTRPQPPKPVTLSKPVISSVKATADGVKVKWGKVSGAASYRVYRKISGGTATEIGTAKGTIFVDEKAPSGKKISYYVRSVDSYGRTVSSYSSAKSISYVKAPVIKNFTNTATGTKMTWSKSEGAVKYKIFMLDSKGSWKALATVKSTSYAHNGLKSGKTYTYTVRCIGPDGKYVSAYNTEGFANIFLTSPDISSLKNVNGGVRISWEKKSGAAFYSVYRKTSKSEWKEIGKAKGTSYTDKTAVSGKKYTYAVKCLNSEGKSLSKLNSGKSITYVKAPLIKSFTPTATGVKITWSKVDGAAKYTVYSVDSEGKITALSTVKTTSYTHDKLKSGKNYTYTVKCLNSDGKVVSAGAENKSFRFVAPQSIATVSKNEKGILIQWSAVKNVKGYRVLRKTLGGKFEKLADVKGATSYIDTTADSKTVYSYSLRCLDGNGSFMSYYKTDTKYYINGKPAEGTFTVNGNKYRLSGGLFRSGLQTIDGKKYYYDSTGNVQKKGIVGSKNDGYYYADKNGVINMNYVNGITYNGESWIVSNGKAKKATTKSDIVLFRAAKEVAKATDTSMTKAQKLRACFDYCKKAYKEYNPRIPHYKGMDWPIVYANDMFVGGGGNCFSYGAAFAYMAKAIGYTEVYCCNSGGHGWAEIDGKIYDPEWSRHHSNYTYFGLDYNKIKNPNYKGAIAAGYPWMHIKI